MVMVMSDNIKANTKRRWVFWPNGMKMSIVFSAATLQRIASGKYY